MIVAVLFVLICKVLLLLLGVTPGGVQVTLQRTTFYITVTRLTIGVTMAKLNIADHITCASGRKCCRSLLRRTGRSGKGSKFCQIRSDKQGAGGSSDLCKCHSTAIFSSLVGLSIDRLFRDLCVRKKGGFCYCGNTSPLPSTVFSIGCVLSSGPRSRDPLQAFIKDDGKGCLCQGGCYLPLNCVVDRGTVHN